MRIARRAVLVEPGAPVEIWESPVPSPGPGETLVRVELAGVCGTDHHFMLGEVELPGPMVLGHEGIGRVEELGEGVSTDYAGEPIEPGDLVYWIPLRPCRRCYACTVLEDASMCQSLSAHRFRDPRGPSPATYNQYALLLDGMAFFRVPPDTPPEAVIAFGCAMPTMLHAFERLGGVQYGQRVVVQGCGPVGLAAVVLAQLAGAGSITVIGAPAARLRMAERLGATTTIDLTEVPDADARKALVMEATAGQGADVVIEAAGKLPAFSEGLRLVVRGGRYLVVGLWSAPGAMPVEPRDLNNRNLRIIGSALERPRHVYQAVEIARKHHAQLPLAEVVSHRFPLEAAQDALDSLARLETIKAVIVPNGAHPGG